MFEYDAKYGSWWARIERLPGAWLIDDCRIVDKNEFPPSAIDRTQANLPWHNLVHAVEEARWNYDEPIYNDRQRLGKCPVADCLASQIYAAWCKHNAVPAEQEIEDVVAAEYQLPQGD